MKILILDITEPYVIIMIRSFLNGDSIEQAVIESNKDILFRYISRCKANIPPGYSSITKYLLKGIF